MAESSTEDHVLPLTSRHLVCMWASPQERAERWGPSEITWSTTPSVDTRHLVTAVVPRSVTRTKVWQVPSYSLFSPKRFSILQHQAQRSPRLPGAGPAKMHLSSQVPAPPTPGRATLKPHVSAEHPRFPDCGLSDLCAHLLAAGLGMVTLPGGSYEHRRTPGQAALTCTKPVQTCVLGAGVEAKFAPRPFVPSGF